MNLVRVGTDKAMTAAAACEASPQREKQAAG
jgi:hypothetical protein